MVADINSNEVTKEYAGTSIKGLKQGLVPAARAVRLQICGRDLYVQTDIKAYTGLYNISMQKWYLLIHCVFDSSIARKCMRTVDEKQDMI